MVRHSGGSVSPNLDAALASNDSCGLHGGIRVMKLSMDQYWGRQDQNQGQHFQVTGSSESPRRPP